MTNQSNLSMESRCKCDLLRIGCILLLLANFLALSVLPCHAQIGTLTQTDIGGTGATGTYSYSSGTYTIAGAGTGIGGTADSFSYVSMPASGNVEIIGKVTSQTNTSSYAVAGLMIRDSLNANAAQAVVGVSPANGVNFTYRVSDGSSSTTILGPSQTAPIYLRLVRTGSSIAGYQSSDGIGWNLVGSYQVTMPTSFYIGFAVSSNVYGTLSTAVFNSVNFMGAVPQRSTSMLGWYRADAGVFYNSTLVNYWVDQSANSNNAVQPTSGDQPTLTTGALNGLPAISFSGSPQVMSMGSDFANLASGASVYAVVKPTSSSATGNIFETYNSGPTDLMGLSTIGTEVQFQAYNGTSGSSLTTASGAVTVGQYQLVEAIQNGQSSATIYVNGVQQAQGTVNNFNSLNPVRGDNYIAGNTNYFQGSIAELIVYGSSSTTYQRASIESYIYSKYGIGNPGTLDTPTITVNGNPYGVFSSPPQVTIAGDANCQLYYTTNGSTPTPSSTPYTAPFTLTSTATVKAIAVQQYFTTSAVGSSFFQIDPTTANLPTSNLQFWLKADNGVNLGSGSNVASWTDMSGNNNNASQNTSGDQPTLVTNAVNGLPAISFNGTSQFLQLPSGFSNFPGLTMFIVTNPTSDVTGNRWLSFCSGSTTNEFGMYEYAPSTNQFFSNNGTSGSGVGLTITQNVYQLLEGVQAGSNSGTVYLNGGSATTATMYNVVNVSRSTNCIGAFGGGGSYFKGDIAEILVYNTALTAGQRKSVESYIYTRYGLGTAPTLDAPVISPSFGVFGSAQPVSITSDSGAPIYFTTNGTSPVPGASGTSLYTGSFLVSSSTTINAIAAAPDFTTSPVASSFLQIDLSTAGIPRSSLQAWLKADNGITFGTGSSVASWTDMSGNGNNATQATSSAQPILTNGAINGLPSINFNGTNQCLVLPAGFANYTAGATIFIVTNPTNLVEKARWLSLGNGGPSGLFGDGEFGFYEYPTDSQSIPYVISSSGGDSSVASSVTQNQYQVIETIQNGSAGTGNAYTNGLPPIQTAGTLNAIANVTRNTNLIGQYTGGGNFFQGYIAEILIYNVALTASQRAAIETYLIQRYQLGTQIPTAPVFSVATSTLSGPTQVAIAAQPGATIYYAINGTPTTSSPVYSGPVNVYYTETINAIAVSTAGVSSSVTSATYTLNSTQWPAPSSTDPTTLQLNLQLPMTAVP
jgi:hypothetical protein